MAVKRILRYLKNTPTHDLFYKPGALFLEGFSDTNYGGDSEDKHSTGGYCIYLGVVPFIGVLKNIERSPALVQKQSIAN